MTAPIRPDLALGPEWAILELLCHPPQRPDRDDHLRTLLHSPRLHWGELLEQALRHKLLPTLAAHLSTQAADTVVPRPMAAHLRLVWRTHQHRAALYRGEAERLTKYFRDAGIPAVVVRGLALESTAYGGDRAFSDLDLLVEADDNSTRAVLQQLGYTASPRGSHRRGIEDPTTGRIVVDLCTSPPDAPPASPAAHRAADRLRQRLLSAATPPPPRGLPVPAAVDHILLLTWQLASRADRGAQLPLLSFADLLRLLTATPPPQRRTLAAAVAGWPTAQRRLQWALTATDDLFGSNHLTDSGPACASASEATPLGIRRKLHAKNLPSCVAHGRPLAAGEAQP